MSAENGSGKCQQQLAEFRRGTTVNGYAKYYKSFRWPWQNKEATDQPAP